MATTGQRAAPAGGALRGTERFSSRMPWLLSVIDPALVLSLTVLAVVSLPQLDDATPAYREADALAFCLVGLAAAATAVRRRWPVGAGLVAAAAVGSYLALSFPYGPIFGFVVLTVYTVARSRHVGKAAVTTLATLATLLIHLPMNEAAAQGAVGVLPALAWVAIPFTIGAARRLVVEAGQRERAVADARLIDAERLRVSQEVHDVVGHGLAAIQMQADVTLHVNTARPERMQAALQMISAASRDALDELRATVASIRPDDPRRAANMAPAPGLARVEQLCQRVQEAGIRVELIIEGNARPLPGAADVAAYRVLQEALTNVVKHSAHQAVHVRLRYEPQAITLDITNQHLGPLPGDGVGISGMRRRVEQVGGKFRAGPGPRTGTFHVTAAIPAPVRSPKR